MSIGSTVLLASACDADLDEQLRYDFGVTPDVIDVFSIEQRTGCTIWYRLDDQAQSR